MKEIIIDENSIFKVKIEDRKNFSSSFFSDIYSRADKILEEIRNNSKININEEINNIIAFAGERGAGKTSAMISFANGLPKNEHEILKTIDPSVFSKSDSIIEIIVAQMFKKFKDFKNNCDETQQKRPALMKQFQKVYKGLRILNSNKTDIYKEHEDDLEVLIDLTSGISLKLQLEELIEDYLEYIDKKILVIPIDDLDMNIANGDKMLEDIRKYLLIHNVVILMAVKIEQMKDSVQQKYITDFKEILHNNKNKKEDEKEEDINVKFMANKYLEKIIPVERRLVLPKLNESDAKIIIKINEQHIQVDNIRDIIKIKLFEKLNMIMIFDDQNDKLIPQTLRGIIDLIKILFSMENIDRGSDEFNLRKMDGAELKSNINIFKNYILNDWCDENIKYQHYEFLKEVDEIKPELLNRRIVHHLGNKIVKNLKDDEDNKVYKRPISEEEIELLTYAKIISDREVNHKNISIGEVNTCIYAYDKITFKEETKRFILALKILYTLKLLKLRYCELGGEERIKDVFAGDFFGEYFYISKNTYRNKFKAPLKVQNNSLKIKLDKEDVIGIVNIEENIGNNNKLIEDSGFMHLGINKVIESLDTLNKQEELTYLYSLIVPQFSSNLGNLFHRDKYYEYKILGVSSYYNNFYFKPLNILSSYIYLDDIKNRVINAKLEQDNEIDEKVIDENHIVDSKLKNLIIDLVINQDLFMKITDKLDEELNKVRFTNKAVEIIDDINQKVKLSIEYWLESVYNNDEKLNCVNSYKQFIKNNVSFYIEQYGDFICDNISIIANKNEGYLGEFYDDNQDDNKDNIVYFIITKLKAMETYLSNKSKKTSSTSLNNYIFNSIVEIKDVVENTSLQNIKNILSMYEDEIKQHRRELIKIKIESPERKTKIDELKNLIIKLRVEIEKGA